MLALGTSCRLPRRALKSPARMTQSDGCRNWSMALCSSLMKPTTLSPESPVFPLLYSPELAGDAYTAPNNTSLPWQISGHKAVLESLTQIDSKPGAWRMPTNCMWSARPARTCMETPPRPVKGPARTQWKDVVNDLGMHCSLADSNDTSCVSVKIATSDTDSKLQTLACCNFSALIPLTFHCMIRKPGECLPCVREALYLAAPLPAPAVPPVPLRSPVPPPVPPLLLPPAPLPLSPLPPLAICSRSS